MSLARDVARIVGRLGTTGPQPVPFVSSQTDAGEMAASVGAHD